MPTGAPLPMELNHTGKVSRKAQLSTHLYRHVKAEVPNPSPRCYWATNLRNLVSTAEGFREFQSKNIWGPKDGNHCIKGNHIRYLGELAFAPRMGKGHYYVDGKQFSWALYPLEDFNNKN